MDVRVYKAIIANLMDRMDEHEREEVLTPPQLTVAMECLNETRDAGDWQFDDTSDKFNDVVVDKFLERYSVSTDSFGRFLVVDDTASEEFVRQLKEMVK